MNSIYKKLAVHLDRIPNGFPATESCVELKILAKLFTPEEAELACALSLEPESAESIARRLGREVREISAALKGMVKKGLIDLERGKGGFLFKLIPFIVGFYERQNANIDEEFARLFEQYYQEALHRMMTVKPSVHRVIPIDQAIPVNIDIMPYERASHYIETAGSWGVLKCICRVQKSLIGQGCGHTVENCLVFSSRPNQFDRTERIRTIDKKEALRILEEADREGLVHSTSNVQDGINYICNCCSCSCGVMRGVTQYGSPDAIARSDFRARIDESLCAGCGVCVDRCPFKALSTEDGTCHVSLGSCFGCGLCVSSCPTEAVRLVMKAESEIETPPENEKEWMKMREEGRNRRKEVRREIRQIDQKS